MTALARAIDVLPERPLVTLHDVPRPATSDAADDESEREKARPRGKRGQGQPMVRDAGNGDLGGRSKQVHVVSVLHERSEEPESRRLHAAVKDERPSDDEQLHADRSRV
jgi:hypothetical protein